MKALTNLAAPLAGLCLSVTRADAQARQMRSRLGSTLPEHPLPGALADRHDGGIPDLPLDRDRIKVCPYILDLADALKPVPATHDAVQDRRRGKNTQPRLAECAQQGKIVELSYHSGPNVLRVEPLILPRANSRFVARYQERGTVERAGKIRRLYRLLLISLAGS